MIHPPRRSGGLYAAYASLLPALAAVPILPPSLHTALWYQVYEGGGTSYLCCYLLL